MWGVDTNSVVMQASSSSTPAKVYKKALEAGSTDGLLVGAPTKVVYRRYN